MAGMEGMDVTQQITLLMGQVNTIASRLDNLHTSSVTSDTTIATLRTDTHHAIQRMEQQLREIPSTPSGGREHRIKLIDDRNDPPAHFGRDPRDHLRFREFSKKHYELSESKVPGLPRSHDCSERVR